MSKLFLYIIYMKTNQNINQNSNLKNQKLFSSSNQSQNISNTALKRKRKPYKKRHPKSKEDNDKLSHSKIKFLLNEEENFLYFFNNDINIKEYFNNEKNQKKSQTEKTNLIETNKPNNLQVKQGTLTTDNSDKYNSFFSDDFSFSEEDEKIKNEREKIISEMSKNLSNDNALEILPDFDIFDYSKMIDIKNNDEDNLFEKNKNGTKPIYNIENVSTNLTEGSYQSIQLIKKSNKTNTDRRNKFNRKGYMAKYDKSKCTNRFIEKSRSRSRKNHKI